MVRIPLNTCIYEDLLHNETPSPPRKSRSVLHYYKNPKPLEIKVCRIYPNFGTLKLWTFSNLTFRGYLAGTTSILSVRFPSSLFCRFCLEHVRTVQLPDDCRYHQLAPFMGKANSNSHITISQTKSCMVLTCSMATNNNNEEKPRTSALER